MNKEEVFKFIKKKYDPDVSPGEYWISGNMDDCYEVGKTVGYQDCLIELADLLGIFLPKRKEIE